MKNLSLVGKITVFKYFVFSKNVYLLFLTLLPNNIIKEVKYILKNFLQSNEIVKFKHETLFKDYKDGGLKSVDIAHKINALNCSLDTKAI